MANIPLKTIKFPGLDDTYTVPQVDNTLSVTGAAADAKKTGDELSEINERLSDVSNAFDYSAQNIPLSALVSDKYINNTGTEEENVNTSYASLAITSEYVGKTLLVSGSAWWTVKPYVFVGTSENVIYAPVPSPSGTYTQYTDLEFIPPETGTLYVNRYDSAVTHIASVSLASISNLKTEYIPSDVGNSILDSVFYKPVTLTLTDNKVISITNRTIEDTATANYKISQYVEVTPFTNYLITTRINYGNGVYAWFDENYTFISGLKGASGSTITAIYCEKVTAPENAKYLVIGYLLDNTMPVPFLMEGEMNSIYPSKRWSGKKWACVGDSLTAAYSVTGAHYFNLISASTGIECVNLAVSGCGYARGTSNFMAQALLVPNDSDVVTFFGSGNDASSSLELGTASDTGTTTIGGCINTAIDNLYSIMPVVQLGIVTPAPWKGNMPYDNGWMERYSNLIVEICKRRSIPCLDLFHCSNLDPNSQAVRQLAYAKDGDSGVHPSELGHQIIAPRFLNFLESLLMH